MLFRLFFSQAKPNSKYLEYDNGLTRSFCRSTDIVGWLCGESYLKIHLSNLTVFDCINPVGDHERKIMEIFRRHQQITDYCGRDVIVSLYWTKISYTSQYPIE